MMDYDKLIERLRTESLYADKASLEIMDLCMEAATALSTLQAENEKLHDLWSDASIRLEDELDENEKLRAELEQVKRERDAAVERLREWEKFDIYLLAHNFLIPEKWRGIQKED